MKRIDNKRIIKLLIALWLLSSFIVSTCASHYLSENAALGGQSREYQLSAMAIVFFYFCPLTAIIHQYAIKAKMKYLAIIARIVFILHIIWIVLYSLHLLFGSA